MASNGFREWYDGLEPGRRQNLVKGGAVGTVLVAALALYYASGQDQKAPPPAKANVAVIDVGEGRLEDDMRSELERSKQELANQNKRQDESVESLTAKLQKQEEQNTAILAALQGMSTGGATGLPDADGLGLAPNNPADWEKGIHKPGTSLRSVDPSSPPPVPPPVEMIGGIGSASAPADASAAAAGDKKKATGPRFYLPVSFMPAKLLTGLKAKTVESARGDPEPILLRVQAPAQLPNEIRAELQGCLVVAHGYGSLSSERVEARLVSINCLNMKGQSIIEADITGILVDKDGVKGLAGHPVSKMGTNLARLAFAAAIEGAGSAFADQASTVSVSPLGQTQTVDPTQIGRAGVGEGVSKAASEYGRIIADLVRQQAPVLEVGPTKDVTVVLTEGVWLDIKSFREGGL